MLISNRYQNIDTRPSYNIPLTTEYKKIKDDKNGGTWYFNPQYQHYYYRPLGMTTLIRPTTNNMYDYSFEVGVARGGSFNYDIKSGSYYYQPITKGKTTYSEGVKQRQYMTPQDFHTIAQQTPGLIYEEEKKRTPWVALDKEGWFFNKETGNYGYRPVKKYTNPFDGKVINRRSKDDNDIQEYTPQQMQQKFGFRDPTAEKQTKWDYLGKDIKTIGDWYLNPVSGEYAYKIGNEIKYFTKQQMQKQFGRAPEATGYTERIWASPPKLNFATMEFVDLNYQKRIAENQMQQFKNYLNQYKNYLSQEQIKEIENKSKEWFTYYTDIDKALSKKNFGKNRV